MKPTDQNDTDSIEPKGKAPKSLKPDNLTPEEQAADWHARLCADTVSPEDFLVFDDWLSEADVNGKAYHDIVVAEEIAKLAQERQPKAKATILPNHWRMTAITGGLAALAALFFMVVMVNTPTALPGFYQQYQSAPGQAQRYTLPDGSEIMLDGGTTLAVAYETDIRKIRLDAGAAIFDVASNPERPFIVSTKAAEVTVVGTRFLVDANVGVTEVAVEEGIVQVEPRENTSQTQSYRLEKTDRILLRAGGDVTLDRAALKGDVVLIANQEQFRYEKASLREVTSDLERVFDRRFRLSERAAKLSFTGSLSAKSLADIKLLLTASLPILWIDDGEAITLRMKAKLNEK